jgi:hypothetical protein
MWIEGYFVETVEDFLKIPYKALARFTGADLFVKTRPFDYHLTTEADDFETAKKSATLGADRAMVCATRQRAEGGDFFGRTCPTGCYSYRGNLGDPVVASRRWRPQIIRLDTDSVYVRCDGRRDFGCVYLVRRQRCY